MKVNYPYYQTNRSNPESEIVFNSLSKKNKTALLNFMETTSITSKSSKRTENRRRAIIRLFDFLEKDYDKITKEDYIKLAKAISNSKYGVHTRNADKDFIKRFLKSVYPNWRELFGEFKELKFETKSEENRLEAKDLIKGEELEKLIKTTTDLRYKTLITLAYETAGRSEELLKLKVNDVDFNKGLVFLYSIKTKRKRYIPIQDSLPQLKRLIEETGINDEDYLFNNKGKKLSNSGVNKMIKTLSKRAGIKRNIYLYMFRHTRLSQLITELSPKVYEEVAGHSLAMGMKTYAHLSQDKIIKEMNNKIFKVKDLTPEEKDQIAELKKQVAENSKIIKKLSKALEKLSKAKDMYSRL